MRGAAVQDAGDGPGSRRSPVHGSNIWLRLGPVFVPRVIPAAVCNVFLRLKCPKGSNEKSSAPPWLRSAAPASPLGPSEPSALPGFPASGHVTVGHQVTGQGLEFSVGSELWRV